MNDKFDEIEKMLDEVEKAFINEELERLRRARVMLFLRLIALIGIFVLCISNLKWLINLW